MSEKKLLPAELDPRNPSYAYKNKYNEHVENTDQFNNYVKSTEVKKVFSGSNLFTLLIWSLLIHCKYPFLGFVFAILSKSSGLPVF